MTKQDKWQEQVDLIRKHPQKASFTYSQITKILTLEDDVLTFIEEMAEKLGWSFERTLSTMINRWASNNLKYINNEQKDYKDDCKNDHIELSNSELIIIKHALLHYLNDCEVSKTLNRGAKIFERLFKKIENFKKRRELNEFKIN